MRDIEYESFSLLKYLKEADGDEGGNTPSPDAGNDAAQGDNNAAGNEGNDNNAGGGDEAEATNPDLSDLDGGDNGGGDDMGDIDTGEGDDSLSGGGNQTFSDDMTQAPVKGNTSMFGSLDAKEQQIKIKELKTQYKNLFNACEDLLYKLSRVETDESNIIYVERLTEIVLNTKRYIIDYVTNSFADTSYYENDVKYNRFLVILNSISDIINKMAPSGK